MPENRRPTRPGEFSIWEVDHRYTRESGKLENDATTAGTNPDVGSSDSLTDLIGQPVVLVGGVHRFATAAEVTTGGVVTGFVVDGELLVEPIAADELTPNPYAILAQGPALVNEGAIPALDVYGDAIVKADYIADLVLLRIKSMPIPVTTSTQTT